MTVHFIGAGPGAPDLITVRGRNLIANAPVCLYAGSLVPKELLEEAPRDARILDTASMTLDEIINEIKKRMRRVWMFPGCIPEIRLFMVQLPNKCVGLTNWESNTMSLREYLPMQQRQQP